MKPRKLLLSLFLIGFLNLIFSSLAYAQPEPPINTYVQSYATYNRISWTHNPANPAGYVTNYQICRSTTSGAEVPVGLVGYTTAFNDNTPGYSYEQEFYYTIRAVGSDSLISTDSEEGMRFIPVMNLTDSHIFTHGITDRFYGSWRPYPAAWTNTYYRIRTTPLGGSNYGAVSFSNNQLLRYQRDVSIPEGGPYYLEILIGRPDYYGTPNNNRWIAICDSLPFYIDVNIPFEDNASSTYFNNSPNRTMAAPKAVGGVAPFDFQNSGGGFWRMRQPIRLRSGIDLNYYGTKLNAPCRYTVTVPAGQISAGRAAAEARIADEYGHEVPSVVMGETNDGTWVTSFDVHFIVSQYYNLWDTYWVYYANPSASAPTYDFKTSCTLTSQFDYTPWFSRKLIRGQTEWYSTSNTYRLIPNPPSPADDEFGTRTMGFTFPFFDYATDTISLSANGYISFLPYSQPNNTWGEFSGANGNHFIAPLWANLMVNDTVPSDAGLYYYRRDTGNQYRHREIYTWSANRFNSTNEIYLFQTILYAQGDVTFKYGTLNFNALWGVPSSSGDNPVNVPPHHTAGISATDGNRWLRITDNSGDLRASPLRDGTGQNPIHHFQSCYSWRFDNTYVDPTNLCSMAGLTTVAHYDSRIFDGKSTDPTWGSLEYTISGAGAVDLYVRTGADLNLPDWNLTHLLASNLTAASSSIALSLPNDRYLQYRLVLKKANAGDTPSVDRIKLNVGYITIDETINDKDGQDVSQGQTMIATFTLSNHFSSSLDAKIASLTFTPATASQSWNRISPLSTGIAPEASASMLFSITVATNSGNLDNWTYVDGYAEAGDGVATLTSSAALVNSSYRIRERANLEITKAETAFDKVNKGQGGIPVALHITNTSGYVPMTLNGASLTFTLGNYSWSPEVTFSPAVQGLYAEYFTTDTSTNNLIEPPVITQVDNNVDNYWVGGTPFAVLGNDYYGARWSGYIIPQFTETYTFYAYTDDGSRLWVDGQLLVDRWSNGNAERSGTINCTAGVKIPVVFEFYERTGNSRAILSWSSPSTPKAAIPQSQLRPGYIPVIHPNETKIVSFTVAVLPDSPSGLAYISGTASATNGWVPGMITDSSAALTRDSWIIQSPAELSVGEIVNPDPVYRGQGNVEVEVEIFNLGEAEGLIGSSPLYFTLGSYTAMIPGQTMPVSINGGDSKFVKVLVSIAEDTPTGTAIIDADVTGFDGNVGTVLNASGAASPGEWTILAEKILTYTDPSFLYPTTSFTRPEIGTVKVFALAENLAPLKEYAIRWYDASGTEIIGSTTIGFSDPSGTLSAEWRINPYTDYGVYNVKITNPVNTFSPAQTGFRVVTSASVSAELVLPEKVSVGQTFNGDMGLINIGGAAATGMVPSALTETGPGTVTTLSGPLPASVEVPGESTATTTWQFLATNPGLFTISGNAAGFDGNSLEPLVAEYATSANCLIQTPANVTINDLIATPSIVYIEQHNIEVLMPIENSGEADALIDLAQLLFTPGFGSYTIASPTIPAILPGNTIATYVFNVNINTNAPAGMATLTGRIRFSDVNNPSPVTVTDKTKSWEIQLVRIECYRNSALSQEQYSFNDGTTIYAKASGLPLNTDVRMRFYESTEPYPPTGPGVGILTPLNSGVDGVVSHFHDIPANTPAINRWMVVVDDDLDGDPMTIGNILGVQFFDVMMAATFTVDLDLGAPEYYVNDDFYANFTITNNSTWTTNVRVYLQNFNFQYLAGSQGTVSNPALPARGWFSLPSGASYTFAMPMVALTDSGLVGSCSIRAPASAIRLYDDNSRASLYSPVTNCNNPIRIFQKSIDLASDVWDFGYIEPGNTSDLLETLVTNTGNRSLDTVEFAKVSLRKTATETLSGSYLEIAPDLPITIATTTSTIISSRFEVPFHQPAGNYIATMAIYDDQNFSGTLDVKEAHDLVQAIVRVPSIAKAIVTDDLIDLGVIEPGGVSASYTVEFVGIGNQDLTDLKFTVIPDLTFDPENYGPLAFNGFGSASLWINVPATMTPGVYEATGTLYDDISGGASDSFTIRWSVGTQSLALLPDIFEYGFGTPTFDLPTQFTDIENTGQVPLSKLIGSSLEFVNIEQPGLVGTDNIALNSPLFIGTGLVSAASAAVYVPGGTGTGTYLATYTWFEDLNANGIMDSFEPRDIGVASFVVESFYRLYSLKTTEDFGGVKPGTVKLISVGFRNAGSLPISEVRYEIASLTDGTSFFDVANISVTPDPSLSINAGELRYVDVTADVPSLHSLGIFTGNMTIYADVNTNGTRDPDEAFCTLLLRIEIGDQEITLVSPPQINLSGAAASQTNSVFVSLKNTGSLTLSRVKVETTELTPVVPGTNIASTAFSFNPSRDIGPMVLTQTKTISTSVNIPVGQPPGTYTGVLWAWEDSNDDNIIQAGETATSVPVVLSANYIKALKLVPNTVNFGIMARGDIASAGFLAQNIGNSALLDARYSKQPLVAGAGTINTSQITIIPDPIGAMVTPPPGFPVSEISTISVLIPNGAVDGSYVGSMTFYEDDFNPGLNTFDSGTESNANLLVQLQVVTPFVAVNPDPITFAAMDPLGWTATKSLEISNSGLITFKHLKFTMTDLVNGGNIIPVASISILPTIFPALAPSAIEQASVSVNVDSFTTPPGLYSGTLSFWDDRNNNDVKDSWETVTNVDVNLPINSYSALDIIPATFDAGKIARGTFSTIYEIPFRNTGNVNISGLTWSKTSLASGSEFIPIASLSFGFAQPEPILPGEYATATLQIGRISVELTLGEYGPGTQLLTGGSPPSDVMDLKCEIIPGGPQGLNKGSLYQEIATLTFPAFPAASGSYILSGYICPGSGSARIGFLLTDEVGITTGYQGVEVDSLGNINAIPPTAVVGSTEKTLNGYSISGASNLWYRVFLRFPYRYNPLIASKTYILIENTSVDGSGKATYVDAIKLEEVTQKQDYPTSYHPDAVIFSTKDDLDIKGESKYYEW